MIRPAHEIASAGISGGNRAAILKKLRLSQKQSGFVLRLNNHQRGDEIKRAAPKIPCQPPGFSSRFSIILINDLLTGLPSLKWHNFISLTITLSSTHPNPNLSKKMIVSLSISRLTSVCNLPLLFSFFCSDINISSHWVIFFSDSSKWRVRGLWPINEVNQGLSEVQESIDRGVLESGNFGSWIVDFGLAKIELNLYLNKNPKSRIANPQSNHSNTLKLI